MCCGQCFAHLPQPTPLDAEAVFFREQLIQPIPTLDQVMGQPGGNIDLIPDAVFLKYLTDGSFTAGIDVDSIVVIHAVLKDRHDLLLRLFHIDLAHFLLETHTAEVKNGKLVSVFIQSVIQRDPSGIDNVTAVIIP